MGAEWGVGMAGPDWAAWRGPLLGRFTCLGLLP